MATIVINGGNVVSGGGLSGGTVTVRDGIIGLSDAGERTVADQKIEAGGALVAAGFVDVHNHGAVGVDVNEADVEGLLAIGRFLAGNGVTAWMPTLVPDSDENYRRVVGEIDKVMTIQAGMPLAQVVGVHYEGVFANEKMCGALRPEFFKSFTGGELSELPRLKRGVHMTTFAPEIDGGIELAWELKKQGWIASIGHTHAGVKTLDAAFAAGAKHVTHFFNAMSGIHHRDVGVAGWALAERGVTFDIIADGIHVDPKMLELACRAKTADGVTLISDSVAPTGLGDGSFQLWGETVSVENGRTRNDRGSIAGSVITMLDAVRMMLSIGFSEAEVSKMASYNPAKLLGIDGSYGSIEDGKRADLVGLDKHGNIEMVMVGGMRVPIETG
ncbi:MAG TPA: N-acetylglucosamine-6-phosphate deacetylase [Pyrinomonadaceae bacterium]|nr:N-acetylglucosamine-6-phosphate deacetylase [Pyrinomonadaceae bacterium]